MTISDNTIAGAIIAVSEVDSVAMDPRALVEDVFALSLAFTDEYEYLAAIANTCTALNHLAEKRVQCSALKHRHAGWNSFHYQHRVGQGLRADMRIMFRYDNDLVLVRGFGHRDTPTDFYLRMSQIR